MNSGEPSDSESPQERSAHARSLFARRAAPWVGASVAIVVIAGLGWLAFGRSGDSGPPYTTSYATTRCEFALSTDVDVSCGWLTVPENRDDPDNGRLVRLHVAVFESTAVDAPDDPIVYLEGGPGGEVLETLPFRFASQFEPLLAERDLIVLDQRGVGLSFPSLECAEATELAVSQLGEALSPEQRRAGLLAAIIECRDRLLSEEIDLGRYNSAENAADIADLRVALGIDEWNLYGLSYGTRLAVTIMRDHPEGIRSVILDSAYPVESNLLTETARNLDRSLNELWSGCAADSECAAAYPDLERRFFDVVDQLEASAVTLPVQDIASGRTVNAPFSGTDLIGNTFQALYSDAAIAVLPAMIDQLEQGQTEILSLLASNSLANVSFTSLGMYLSVQCHEEAVFTTLAAIEEGRAAYPVIGDALSGASIVGDFLLEACSVWPAGAAAPIENEAVTSNIPTLVLAGEYDPITPPRWGLGVAANLERSTFVEVPGLGHGATLADCPRGVMLSFLDAPGDTPEVACVATMGGIDFQIPGQAIAAPSLVPFTDNLGTIDVSGLRPNGWTEQAPGAYARLQSAIDQTALVQLVGPIRPSLLVPALAEQIGLAAAPEQTTTQISELGEWQLWHGQAVGFVIDIAVIDLRPRTAVILLVSSVTERDQLFDEVLLPAIEAFRVAQ